MQLHPDKGGDAAEFREMKSQYDEAIAIVDKQPILPEFFNLKGLYKYRYEPVIYTHRDNYYYYFGYLKGILQITKDRTDLIFQDTARL